MITLLGRVVSVLLGLVQAVVAGIIEAVNLIIVAIAAAIALAWSLLPNMPAPPQGGLQSETVNFLNWVLPLQSLTITFALWVTAWVTFIAIRALLNWVKLL